MKTIVYKSLSLLSISLLASCALTQDPAQVVDGYSVYPVEPVAQVKVSNLTWEEESLPERTTDTLPKKSKKAVVTYTVEQGDNMHIIARRFNVPIKDIMDRNGMPNENFLSIGQKLTIPQENELNQTKNNRYSLTRSRFEKNIKVVNKEKPKLIKSLPKPPARIVQQHAVQPGENLYRIGKKYGVTPIDLMMYNNIDRPQDLRAGMLLSIPSKDGVVTITQAELAAEKVLNKPSKAKINRVVNSYKKGMIWPVKGKIIKSFGEKGAGINHMGINIAVAPNTPVLAVEDGTVIYSDDGLESYGNLILIRHKNGYVTAYAHNSKNMVTKNKKVKKGEVIAIAGNSGNVDLTQLHFEVRRNAQAINPLRVLPR